MVTTTTTATDAVNDSMNSWFTVEMDLFEADVFDFSVSGHETLTESDVLSTIVSK